MEQASLIIAIVLGLATVAAYLINLGSLRRDIEQAAKATALDALSVSHRELAGDLRPRVSDLEKACKAIEIMTSTQHAEIAMLTEGIKRIDSKLDRLLDRQRNESTVDG